MLLFVYNVIFLVIAGAVLARAAGRPEPLAYVELIFSTPENRIIAGICALIVIVLIFYLFIKSLKTAPKPKAVIIDSSMNGQVSITVEAVKVIIMKAVKEVEGIKEIRPVVNPSDKGLVVYLHMMINPEYSVPEMTDKIKEIVRKYLEELGGLKVAEIKILVDDFGSLNKA
ncbi:MAG: alkaline shock response membrane anchor protein AmaP [Thermosyntropha sp.]|nr:alkaline shock response membrane anchor protein AmaP [Thermosyntropha sp.]